jgi:hypothetical protein
MGTIKTGPTDASVTEFLESVPGERRRAEGHELRAMFERITGEPAVMWGPSMVGFGSLAHTNTMGTNDWFVVGFSARKAALTIYGLVDGDTTADPLFRELGPHTTGKGCLYITRLTDVDHDALGTLIATTWTARHAS